MTWTATIYRVDDATTAERFGIRPRVLGGADGVWRSLRRGLPGLYARGWEGWLAGDGWRMQLSTWRDLAPTSRGAVDSIQVDVEGSGDPLPVLVDLCRRNDWHLFDDECGCFVDLDDPRSASWSSEQPASPPPPRSWAMLLVPEALRREFARREVVLVDLDGPPDPQADAPSRFPLGHADDVRARLDAALPDLRWTGRRGRLRSGHDRLDLQLRLGGLVDTLRLRVSGPGSAELIERICEPNGWSVYVPAEDTWAYVHPSSTPSAPLPDNVITLRPR